jgi:lactoylglutathione lyase
MRARMLQGCDRARPKGARRRKGIDFATRPAGSVAAREHQAMRYLHTMIRVSNLDASLDFFLQKLGMVEIRRVSNEQGRFTLVFLAADEDISRGADAGSPLIELTYNWDAEAYDGGRNFGHLAYEVDNIYAACEKLAKAGVAINRPPRDGRMAFIRTPDGISIELLQKGEALAPREPWRSAANVGTW